MFGPEKVAPVPWSLVSWPSLAELDPVDMAREIGTRRAECVIGGRRMPVPRGEAWFGFGPYGYGGQVQQPRPRPWPGAICDAIRVAGMLAARATGESIGLNACFANFYEGGRDSISWHADDEPWLGPVVVSISIGAPRRFLLRRKGDHRDLRELHLGGGDVLVMHAGCQEAWEHCVPKTRKQVGPRLSLTVRVDRRAP